MQKIIQFFLPMIPPTVTAQEHKVAVKKGKPVLYDPPELKAAKMKLRDSIAPYRPDKPLRGAVRLLAKWCFPITGTHQNGEYKTTRPDTDNLQKALKDVMTGLHFWNDDAQVTSEICEKFYADRPGLYIEVWQL
ncbi:MAG: RusA family crossover junction endodeoxyribonuclease [Ruminococcaceae bacterium]|nr:RusA family crossover junction endodeoxyribonuclease [Oscillospiraceae bacterium]